MQNPGQSPQRTYPPFVVRTITFNPQNKNISVAPPGAIEVGVGGVIRWNLTGTAERFEIVMKTAGHTPFADGEETAEGETVAVGPISAGANHDTYPYKIVVYEADGSSHTLDPDIVVGPPTVM